MGTAIFQSAERIEGCAMSVKRILASACATALFVVLLSGCSVRSYVAPSSAPPSPYFQLTAVPTAGAAIDQTVQHMNDAVSNQAAEEAAAQAAEEAEALAAAEAQAAAEEAARAADSQGGSGYDSSYGSGSVGGQSEDVCLDPVLNF
jgi:hypothetical protein